MVYVNQLGWCTPLAKSECHRVLSCQRENSFVLIPTEACHEQLGPTYAVSRLSNRAEFPGACVTPQLFGFSLVSLSVNLPDGGAVSGGAMEH